MKTITAYNWRWLQLTEGILDHWFNDIPNAVQKECVKTSAEREVFKIHFNAKNYFVKYSHPSTPIQKLRASFSPKLINEFYTVKLLQNYGIPTPSPVAVGFKGSESILITEAIENASDVRTFWFSNYSDLPTRSAFIKTYTKFLKNFFKTNLFHPDFHPGNILVKKNNDQYNFYLIDTYGIKQYKKLPDNKLFQMLAVLGAMRGELSDRDASEIISKITDYPSEKASNLWLKILIHETVKTKKLWKKRKLKVFNNSKYTIKTDMQDSTVLIRKDLTGTPCITIKQLKNFKSSDGTDGSIKIEKLPLSKAEIVWSNSFKMEFHRIPEKKPVALIQYHDKKDYELLYLNNEIQQILISGEEINTRKKLLQQ